MSSRDVGAKIEKLLTQGEAVLRTRKHQQGVMGGSEERVDRNLFGVWAPNVGALVRSVLGESSEHYQRIKNELRTTWPSSTEVIIAVLRSMLDAVNEGYVFDFRGLVRADVESDLISQASDLLDAGHDRAACVIAGSVLEAHLRDIAASWGVIVTNAAGKHLTLGPLAIELKKVGAFDGIMQKKVDYLAGLRNEAAHGNPFENRAEDVRRMIADVLDVCDRVKGK
ncbi:MAG TPA: hypothetical protein VER11_29765 [Polyangiaceae bacterium]|nr:hypothetical protein [Polyangiaceae bacterium]